MFILFLDDEISNTDTDYAFKRICDDLGSPPLFVIDMRPLFYPICVINSHQVMEQISRPSKLFKYSVFKSPTVKWLTPIIGPKSIITSDGEEWKHIRKRFNPGFAPAHLVTLLPAILSKTERFTSRLDALAKSGNEFELGELCTSLTFDIIGAVVLDEDFKAQSPDQSHIVREYRALTAAFDTVAPFSFPFGSKARRQKRLGLAVDTSIKAVITKKFEEIQQSRKQGKNSSKGRSVLELSLEDIGELTPDVLQDSADQIKSFLFAGHDTTSILLQWAFYLLSTHPHILAKLTEQLDSIFGPSTSPASVSAQLHERGEEALRQLSYISAIIKETLRLYPPASTARMAPKGSHYTVHDPTSGTDMCLDGFVIYGNHYNIGRDKSVYGPDAEEFIPERWLGDTDTSMDTNELPATQPANSGTKIPPTAWRPFERGPRNCIGQELANIEARVILACAARRYKFSKVGVGALVFKGDGEVFLNERGVVKTMGDMYNRRQVTAKPIDDMRMTVGVREE
jgi:cytochrome P450